MVKNSPGTPVINAARLATTLRFLNRVDEAKPVLLDTVAHHNGAPVHHYYLYEIGFLQNDSAAMATEASFVRAQPHWNGNMLELESTSASYFKKFLRLWRHPDADLSMLKKAQASLNRCKQSRS